MYRVAKALNHNAILALDSEGCQEYLLMGKGIGFGKKVSQRIEAEEGVTVYSLRAVSEKGTARELLKELDPKFLEIADAVLKAAEAEFGEIDRAVLFPLADHLAFAARRLKKGEKIINLLTPDIQALFPREFQVASVIRELLWKMDAIYVPDDEIGYAALHVHSAVVGEKVSSAMQIAGAVRECITIIEKDLGRKINVKTLSYNRLMNHIKYMAARALTGETLKLDINSYARQEFPRAYEIAVMVCGHLGRQLKKVLPEIEIGYLAMHIERTYTDEE